MERNAIQLQAAAAAAAVDSIYTRIRKLMFATDGAVKFIRRDPSLFVRSRHFYAV